MAIPVQAQYMKDQFDGDFVLKTFANSNVDNTWMFRSEDVVLLVKEERTKIILQLGGSSHATYKTGKVKSQKESVTFSRPSKNIGEINEAKRAALATVFDGYDSVYDAFVASFGYDSIQEDNR